MSKTLISVRFEGQGALYISSAALCRVMVVNTRTGESASRIFRHVDQMKFPWARGVGTSEKLSNGMLHSGGELRVTGWDSLGPDQPPLDADVWTVSFPGQSRAPIISKVRNQVQDPIISKGSNQVQDYAQLSSDLVSLCCSDTMSDLSIVVGGIRLPGHAAILGARSKVFAAMITAPMREGLTKEIVIEDFEEHVVRQLLRYLYTGSVDADFLDEDVNAMALFQAAHRFDIPSLARSCVDVIRLRLRTETVAEVLQGAMDCETLRAACISFITEHLADVRATEGFRRLAHKRPDLMLGIVDAIEPPTEKLRKA